MVFSLTKTNLLNRNRQISGLVGSAKSWYVGELIRDFSSILVVCKDRKQSEEVFNDLCFFAGKYPVSHFTGWDTLPFEYLSPQPDISAERLRILFNWKNAVNGIVVASIEALSQKILPLKLYKDLLFKISSDDYTTINSLKEKFQFCGYKNVSIVEEIGDIAIRGEVMDFFPADSANPIRVEFIEGKINDIRTFDPESQRSLEKLENFNVLPVREYINITGHAGLSSNLQSIISRIKTRARELEVPPREENSVVGCITAGNEFPGIELAELIGLSELESPVHYLPPVTLIVLNDKSSIIQSSEKSWDLLLEREENLKSQNFLIPYRDEIYSSPEEIQNLLIKNPVCELDSINIFNESDSAYEQNNIKSNTNTELVKRLKSKVGSGSAFKPLANFIQRFRKDDFSVALVVGSPQRAERLHKILLDVNYDAQILGLSGTEWSAQRKKHTLAILPGHLTAGVQIPDQKILYIAEAEIFSERSYRSSDKAKKTNLKKILSSLSQLKEEDYVVHIDYGIGVYKGLKHREIDGSWNDLLQIEYADSTLFLPVQNIGKIQRFSGGDGQRPQIDKLSSTRWVKTKRKVREALISLAGELINLYATRSIARGWRFEPFGAEDERFADMFQFDETQDQAKAIEETIEDMSKEKPMDRLVCGDVGFGKTEVALRASFKCIQHARQTAILVPTTILVEQHRQTFESRFKEYPVKIGALSRFYSSEENKKTISELASGELDVIIGTHKLLSRDIKFKDLGLLIIDEEHRFGVKQKEQLKQLRKQIDVLTLTATPIPRTLHMSLLGIRDISVINTAPTNRRVIRTYIATYSDALIRDAILRELERGGQCFFLYNKVQSIELMTAKLIELVPEARFQYAHGQMSERELENKMKNFLSGEIDVLVSTTIIESGLDIPNANTIIVERADTFGLAQLYQLRGRVGRGTRQAYSYFLVPKTGRLGDEASKRLKVLQSLDDLGLGFNLALRDLEIRGAGNLLGKEQSGNVLAVGFDLYTRILKEAILNLKGDGEEILETIDPEVKISTNAYIPDAYIPDVSERLVLYQRLASISSSIEAEDLSDEIQDRFGPYGDEVSSLIEIMRIRSLLKRHGIIKVEISGSKLSLFFVKGAPIDPDKISKLIQKDPKKYKLGKNLTFAVNYGEYKPPELDRLYREVGEILEMLEK